MSGECKCDSVPLLKVIPAGRSNTFEGSYVGDGVGVSVVQHAGQTSQLPWISSFLSICLLVVTVIVCVRRQTGTLQQEPT